MLEWIEPKTDWKSTDFFNYNDYNRIIGNIAFVRELAEDLFNQLTILSLGEEKAVTELFYAREMNVIEDSLDTLNKETYLYDIGEKKTYKPNGSTPDYAEFNRIEKATLKIYETLISQKEALPRLSFRLGNQKGLRV